MLPRNLQLKQTKKRPRSGSIDGSCVAVADALASGTKESVCWVCRRKFGSPVLLARHIKLSQLHKQKVEAAAAARAAAAATVDDDVDAALDAALEAALDTPTIAAEAAPVWTTVATNPKRAKHVVKPAKEKEEESPFQLLDYTDAFRGLKPTMEDRHIRAEMDDMASYFGVYDGHGGQACAEYVVKHMHNHIRQSMQRLATRGWEDDNICAAITEGFHKTDAEFLKLAKRKKMSSGSTALVCLCMYPEGEEPVKLFVANLGDCRAVLCRGRRAMRLSSDHKPNRPDEKKRILAAGGRVGRFGGVWRLSTAEGARDAARGDGSVSRLCLATSRAVGDLELKEPTQLVSPTPEIKVLPLTDEDLFLILACDGVWDILTDQQAVDLARPFANDVQAAAKAITRAAYRRGSADNITCTVIHFKWRREHALKLLEEDRVREREEEEAKLKAELEDQDKKQDQVFAIDMFS